MKTQVTHTSHIFALVVMVLFMASQICQAENGLPYKRKSMKNANRANTSVSYQLSGCGHETTMGLNMSFGTARRLVSFGGLLSNTQKISGFNLQYRESFIPNNYFTSVYAQVNFNMYINQPLSNKIETAVFSTENHDLHNTFNTCEAYIGFGIQQKIFSNIYAELGLGVGGYSRSIQQAEDFRDIEFARVSGDIGVSFNLRMAVQFYLW